MRYVHSCCKLCKYRGRPATCLGSATVRADPKCWSLGHGPLCLWWQCGWRAQSQNSNIPPSVPCFRLGTGHLDTVPSRTPLPFCHWPGGINSDPRSPRELPGQVAGRLWLWEEDCQQRHSPAHIISPAFLLTAVPAPAQSTCQQELVVSVVAVQLKMSGQCSGPIHLCCWVWQPYMKCQLTFP